MVHELVPSEELLDRAVAVAEQTPEDCLEQYAFTKRACHAAALRHLYNRMLGQLYRCLQTGQTHDPVKAYGPPPTLPTRTAA
jgi:hypothetical protein